MNSEQAKIFPLGTDAVTVEFGTGISAALNDRAVGLSKYFAQHPFPGLLETVPAYASLTVFFDLEAVRRDNPGFRTAFDAVRQKIVEALGKPYSPAVADSRLIKIPVSFEAEAALDLEYVAEIGAMTPERVVEVFTGRLYRVFMLGFLPGFAYMGEVDASIAAPRRRTPRLVVPKGSVGIAGTQTGIYPFDSPGGWQIVGRTDFELFTPDGEHPCALKAGDLVGFYDVNG